MPNLALLDILIAMVVVILVLSLVVQSIQTLIKKGLKLKSRSIQSSLVDLFETIGKRPADQAVLGAAAVPGAPAVLGAPAVPDAPAVPGAPALPGAPAVLNAPAVPAQPLTQLTPHQLVADVTTQLKDMGRKTAFGNAMLDSLAKVDLLKVLTRVKAEVLLPGTVNVFSGLLTGIDQLKTELDHIDTNFLAGEASAKFAAMKNLVMPVLHDLEALASGGKIDPAVFFGDLYQLRKIKTADVLAILGEVQQTVSTDLAAAKGTQDDARIKAVEAVDAGLKKIAKQISDLSTQFDAAFAPLVARLEQVDVWYDTVMQGFDERYTRHMKTWGIAISIVVVIFLNANFFSIYRALKADPVLTAAIGKQGPALLKAAQDETAKQAAASTQPANPSATPTPETPATVADVQEAAKKTKDLLSAYESFGIKPLSRQQIYDAGADTLAMVTPRFVARIFGKPTDTYQYKYQWRDYSETFLGWALMVALLSAGAPFWEDTLESLFGIKNLIRQKSGTKNIEEEKGGQPKP